MEQAINHHTDAILKLDEGTWIFCRYHVTSAVISVIIPEALSKNDPPTITMAGSRRQRRQLWLVPPAFFAGLVFILPYLTCRYLPEESKLHHELSNFPRDDSAKHQSPQPDGTFNGIPLYFKQDSQKYSSIHCIGETFQPSNHPWIYRSCHYRHFCFDTQRRDFVLFQSPQERKLDNYLKHHDMMHVSTIISRRKQEHSVSIGSLNTKWSWKAGVPRLEWTPRVVYEETPPSYYEMNVTWIPFHSMAGFNPGHLVWDDWLPIYTLMTLFQLDPTTTNKLLMRYVLPGKGMWATCDFNVLNKERCRKMFDKFLPLMGMDSNFTKFTTNQNFELDEKVPNRTRYVCARDGLAGIGILSDHGTKTHGWEQADYMYTHNHARGQQLLDFSQFMIGNLLPKEKRPPPTIQGPPYKISFSTNSSQSITRGIDFQQQIELVKSSFPQDLVQVQAFEFKELSLKDQVRVAAESSIFITVCGGGAVTATFLPPGASLILYFDATGGAKDNVYTGEPARLDWDYFEHSSAVSTHWLPTNTMNSKVDLQMLTDILTHELNTLQRQQHQQ